MKTRELWPVFECISGAIETFTVDKLEKRGSKLIINSFNMLCNKNVHG